MFKRIIIPLIFVLSLVALVAVRQPEEFTSKQIQYILGTICEIELSGTPTKEKQEHINKAFDLIREYDLILSNYKETSDVSRLNNSAVGEEVLVDKATYKLLEKCVVYFEISEGLFDVTIFPLIRLWGFFKQEFQIPTQAAIEKTLPLIGLDALAFNQKEDQYYLSRLKEGLEIDLGGIGKGFICDEVVAYLKEVGETDFLVNIGGNLFASGKNSNGEDWRIGIRDPRDQTKLVEVVTLSDLAVSTSGDYERCFFQDGKRYAHILNPKTGRPQESVIAVTVLADSATKADAASTVLFLTDDLKRSEKFHFLEISKAYIFKEENGAVLKEIISEDVNQ